MATRFSPEEVRNTALAVALGLTLAAVLFLASHPTEARAERPFMATATAAAEMATEKHVPPVFHGAPTMGKAQRLTSDAETRIAARARDELVRVTQYDNTWMETSGYPMGDVPSNRGACTDVVVRSLREVGIDLQQLVHEDAESDLKGYSMTSTDSHVDHRRVSTMMTFFQRRAMSLSTNPKERDAFRPGDIVFYAWSWGRFAPAEHVAIVSDKKGPRGQWMIIQNGGPKPTETDGLDHGKIVGHFRALPSE